jgi:hypothetical protein
MEQLDELGTLQLVSEDEALSMSTSSGRRQSRNREIHTNEKQDAQRRPPKLPAATNCPPVGRRSWRLRQVSSLAIPQLSPGRILSINMQANVLHCKVDDISLQLGADFSGQQPSYHNCQRVRANLVSVGQLVKHVLQI